MATSRTVKIGGRTFPLAYTMRGMLRMQQSIKDFDTSRIKEILSEPSGLIDILFVMMQDGADLEGRPLDVDKTWVSLHLPPSVRKVVELQIAVIDVMTEDMLMETEEDEERSREVDVVLQEIQKKRTASLGGKSSPGD